MQVTEVYGTMVLTCMLRGIGNGHPGWKAVTWYCGERCFKCN